MGDEACTAANRFYVHRRVAGEFSRGLAEAMGRLVVGPGLNPAAPFGGVKQSGIGREGGHDGLLDYLESKYIAVQW